MASDAPRGTRLEFETSGKLRGTEAVAAQRGTNVIMEFNEVNNVKLQVHRCSPDAPKDTRGVRDL